MALCVTQQLTADVTPGKPKKYIDTVDAQNRAATWMSLRVS